MQLLPRAKRALLYRVKQQAGSGVVMRRLGVLSLVRDFSAACSLTVTLEMDGWTGGWIDG